MIHPDTELRFAGEGIGLGVFATRRIPRGTIVWVLDELDQRFTLSAVRRHTLAYRRLLDRYGFLNGRGERVLCWDIARYVNHACEPLVLGLQVPKLAARLLEHADEKVDQPHHCER